MAFITVNTAAQKHVALVAINRPKELNALNLQVMLEIKEALQALDANDDVRAIVLTGSAKAFAAGADIKQMAGKTAVDMLNADQFSTWDSIKRTKKPLIAAVSGFCLGGGLELAMTCDLILASDTAQFGQPEIKIGVMPGAGGTQRLTRAVGKSKAMEMVLTGRFISATEAEKYGLVCRVVPEALYLTEAFKLAITIAEMSPIAARLAKEAINRSFETHLDEGLHFERKNFYMLFATEDQKEGMAAFVEKRSPNFAGK